MDNRIPENVLDDILTRVNIVELISSYIPLKRAGRNFKAICPFHHEKTASFMVSPHKQIYHCFGCGESGNAFKFLMRQERIDFLEAVEVLAKKSGVILPAVSKQDHRVAGLITQIYKINELAVEFYAKSLNSSLGYNALDYLSKRDINKNSIEVFKLGYAQDKWDALISFLRARNVNLSLIEKAGLTIAKSQGGYYDRFRNRIIFPISDIKSRVVGFGARVLDDSLPKYINSPESPIYTKGRNLYGLDLTKDSIRDEDFVIIVEGYLDMIMAYQEGIKNCVASQGTALTIEQVRLLKRHTVNVVMIYDGDVAGELATLRTLDIFIEEDMNVRVVSLPKGFDPDTYIRSNGIKSLKEKIEDAQNLLDYKIKILKDRFDSKKIEDKAKVASGMLETINKFKNEVLKSEYIRKLSEDLNIREDALLRESKNLKDNNSYRGFNITGERKSLGVNPTEKLLLKLMLEETELIEKIKQSIDPSDFHDQRTARLVSAMFDLSNQGKDVEPNILMNHLGSEDLANILCESIFSPDVTEQQKERIVHDCISRIKKEKIKFRRQFLHEQIKVAQDANDEEKLQSLIQEFHILVKKGEKP